MNALELQANPVADEVVVQDLNVDPRLPFADASYDSVVCCVSIDYLVRPVEVLREAARVLRPGGRVVICGEHIYDGVCDGDCNHCGATRTAKAHTWKNGKCAVCGKASPSKVKLTAQSATARYAKMGATVSAKVTAKGDGLKYQWYVKNAGGTKYSKSAITKAS
jgi:SAM-dependent methyltransferase